MTSGPKLEELHHDDNKPATRGFVREAIDDLAAAVKVGFDKTATKDDIADLKDDFAGLKEDVTGLKEDVTGLKEDVTGLKEDVTGLKVGQERMLSIVQSIDEHFKEHRELPARVEELEADVFKLKTRL